LRNKANGLSNYTYSGPQDSFFDLLKAPFNWEIISKPTVWGGLLADLGLGILLSSLISSHSHSFGPYHSTSVIRDFSAFPVGIGEEALFRGCVQTEIIDKTNSPTLGVALSSILFGAAHIPNATYLNKKEKKRYYTIGIPFITTAGAYYGYRAHMTQSLKESVALHAWYDFALFSLSRLISTDEFEANAHIKPLNFAVSHSFSF
jgi:membrane protease YdiL (CAAX protease family)